MTTPLPDKAKQLPKEFVTLRVSRALAEEIREILAVDGDAALSMGVSFIDPIVSDRQTDWHAVCNVIGYPDPEDD